MVEIAIIKMLIKLNLKSLMKQKIKNNNNNNKRWMMKIFRIIMIFVLRMMIVLKLIMNHQKKVKTSNNMTVTLNDVLDPNFTPNTELENLIYEMVNYLK